MNLLLRLYHGRRIDQLHEEHPEVSKTRLIRDYLDGLAGKYSALVAQSRVGAVTTEYAADILNSLEERFVRKAKRFAITLSDLLLLR